MGPNGVRPVTDRETSLSLSLFRRVRLSNLDQPLHLIAQVVTDRRSLLDFVRARCADAVLLSEITEPLGNSLPVRPIRTGVGEGAVEGYFVTK